VHVRAYRVPQPKGYALAGSRRSAQVPFAGLVYLTPDYKAARVAGREFILPWRFALNYRTPDHEQANAGDYTNFRRFSADATIQFEGDSQ